MRNYARPAVIAVIAILVMTLVVGCIVIAVRDAGTPAATPSPTETVDRPDCDDRDKANKDWQDCGLGILLDPGKTTAPVKTKAPTAPQTPGPTKTPKKRS